MIRAQRGALLAALALACASQRLVSLGETTILSDPAGAQVFIDDNPVGETPVTVELEKRTHRIRLEKTGFDSQTQYIGVHVRNDPWIWLFLGQITASGEHDSKYDFEPSYRYLLVPTAPH